MRIFWDERGYTVTEGQLQREYLIQMETGEIDADITFTQFVRNCQSSEGGTLTEIKNKKEIEK